MSRMKYDHIGFAVALIFLLLAPKIPLGGNSGLPEMSAVSIGIIGLAIWALLSPMHVLRFKIGQASEPCRMLIAFGFFGFVVSLASFNPVSIAYALQYLTYLVMAYLLMFGYLVRSETLGEMKTSNRIMAAVFFVFAVGVIVSVGTGPLYPNQVLRSARNWGEGMRIQQGVGFAEGANGAGALMLVICSLCYFYLRKNYDRASLILALTSVVALLVTLSRGSIIGFFIAVLSLCALLVLRALLRCKTTLRSLRLAVITVVIAFTLVSGVRQLLISDTNDMVTAIAMGFGLDGSDLIERESDRTGAWANGLQIWIEGTDPQVILGRGFRNSQSVGDSGAWNTAHSMYISALGDFGIVGLILLIIPFLSFVNRMGAKILLFGGSPQEHASFVAIIGLLAHNLTETFFYSPVLMTMVMLVFALPAARIVASKALAVGNLHLIPNSESE